MIQPYQTPEERERAAAEARGMRQTQAPSPLTPQDARAEAMAQMREDTMGRATPTPDGGPIRLRALDKSRAALPPQLLELAKQQATAAAGR